MSGILLRFCGCVVAMPVAAWLLPGVTTADPETAWIAGVFLGVLYLIARPVLRLILTPFNCLTLGLAGIVIDAAFVMLAAEWLPGFAIESFWWALATAVLVSLLREGLGSLGKKRRR